MAGFGSFLLSCCSCSCRGFFLIDCFLGWNCSDYFGQVLVRSADSLDMNLASTKIFGGLGSSSLSASVLSVYQCSSGSCSFLHDELGWCWFWHRCGRLRCNDSVENCCSNYLGFVGSFGFGRLGCLHAFLSWSLACHLALSTKSRLERLELHRRYP